jgi:hypothetical protein
VYGGGAALLSVCLFVREKRKFDAAAAELSLKADGVG